MTHFGKIKNYDGSIGKGRIAPVKGGEVLSFRKFDLKDETSVPQQDQRYGYDVKDVVNGERYAINLAELQGEASTQRKQARAQH